MISLKKGVVILVSLSNFFVLAFLIKVYFSQKNEVKILASTASEERKLNSCKEEISELLKGKRSQYICSFKSSESQAGASFDLYTRIKVKNTTINGKKRLQLEAKGNLFNPTQHALEADFCDDCVDRINLPSSSRENVEEVMKQMLKLARELNKTAKEKVSEARRKHNTKKRKKRLAKIKKELCLGEWDDLTTAFIPFDDEEKLDCKLTQLSHLNPLEREKYFNNTLKPELWTLAQGEDTTFDFLTDNLDKITKNPYHFSHHSRLSANLIKEYVQWRTVFPEIETPSKKDEYLEHVLQQVDLLKQSLLHSEGKKDLDYLQKGLEKNFNLAIKQIRPSAPTLLNKQDPSSTRSPSLKQKVLHLYK